MVHPQAGYSSAVSRSNWNLEMLVFEERGKPENPEKNLLEQTQPTYDAETGNRIRATLVGGDCSHHCAIPALPIQRYKWIIFHAVPAVQSSHSRIQWKKCLMFSPLRFFAGTYVELYADYNTKVNEQNPWYQEV